MLVAESEAKQHEKERVVNACFPPLQLSGLSVQELQVLAQHVMLFVFHPASVNDPLFFTGSLQRTP